MSRRTRRKWSRIQSKLDRNSTDHGYMIDPDHVSEAFLDEIEALNRRIDEKNRGKTEKKAGKSSV